MNLYTSPNPNSNETNLTNPPIYGIKYISLTKTIPISNDRYILSLFSSLLVIILPTM